jgi:hypothetical protein
MKHLSSTGCDLDVEAELLKLADESVGGFLGIGTVEGSVPTCVQKRQRLEAGGWSW